MARCHACGKYLGLGIFSRWVPMDGKSFCDPCAEPYRRCRHEQTLVALLRPGMPNCLVAIPDVVTKDPDRPKARDRLVGQVFFSDKGVFFVQTVDYLAADPGWGLLFGWIGAAAAGSAANIAKGRAVEDARLAIADATDLRDLLIRSPRILLYPLAMIERLKVRARGLEIRSAGKTKHFAFEGGRKVYRQFADRARAYADDVNRGVTPTRQAE